MLSGTRSLVVSAMLLFHPVKGKAHTVNEGFSFRFENVAKTLSRRNQRVIGRCKLCGEVVYVTYAKNTAAPGRAPSPEMFSISLLIYMTDECQENLIIERMNQLIGSKVKLRFGQEYMAFVISAATDQNDYENYLNKADNWYVPHATLPVCPASYSYAPDFQQLDTCPSVSLNFTDYNALMESTYQTSKKKRINSLFKLTEKNGNVVSITDAATGGNNAIDKVNFKVQVCFETYQSVLPKKNHGSSCDPRATLLLVLALISRILKA